MKELKVPEMHCQMCVKRINDALTAAKIPHEVDLETKTVKVAEDRIAEAISELDDLGFEAHE